MRLVIALLTLAFAAAAMASLQSGRNRLPDTVLMYDTPAKDPITEGLPIGNGRMGALICGDPAHDRLVLNEDSLWTGDDNPSGNYDTMGAYQCLGNLFVDFDGLGPVQNYRRGLDIASAFAETNFQSNGTRYVREYFCSHPGEVLAARYLSDHPGALTGVIRLLDSHTAQPKAENHDIVVAGTLPNGLKYRYILRAVNQGGTVQSQNGQLVFRGCDKLDLYVVAATDYAMNHAAHYRGADPATFLPKRLDEAVDKAFDRLRAEHIQDYTTLFNRVQLNLGESPPGQQMQPTDVRKIAAATTVDPGLEALMFQYGRYLLISCSRPGGLPANLQGLWNDSNTPPWSSDYHTNINIEMNYWPAEVTNLAECQLPLFDLIESQIPAWRAATAADDEMEAPNGQHTTRGFALRTSHNIDGGMGWRWDHTANAWYCQHFWEHYAFGLDKSYLKTTAYPILKGTTQFWEDHLKRLPDGRLVVPNAWSPEHGPTEDGVSYSQEIVWDLFTNFVQASEALGVDAEYRTKIAGMRDHLATPGIGSWGQLMELMTEKGGKFPEDPDLDTPRDHHRHTSHLFAVYPGHQIGVEQTPKLAAAAKVSLDARGETGDVREWSFAWRTALYGRLHDGESAHRMFQQLFSARNTCPNLFGLHPPMQMDGNFGITAGIAELLVQSHEQDVSLLPALPSAWPVGEVSGLRARGGFVVGVKWKDGKLVSATVRATKPSTVRVRYGTTETTLRLHAGQTASLGPTLSSE